MVQKIIRNATNPDNLLSSTKTNKTKFDRINIFHQQIHNTYTPTWLHLLPPLFMRVLFYLIFNIVIM